MPHPYDVAIVGGGFSGGMLAAQLVTARRKHPIHVALIDRTGRFGRGVAYSTPNPRHLLNVPAGLMSVVGDEPGNFVAWAKRRVSGVDAGTYLPRTLFGDYVASVLDDAIRHRASRSTIELRVAAARRFEPNAHGDAARLHLEDGDVFAKKVVLATGNSAPRPLEVAGFGEPQVRAHYVHDPWAPGALEGAVGTSDVLVIGTGLTMIDVAFELVGRGHRGRVIAISRRGLLPQAHTSVPQPAAAWLDRAALGSSAAGLSRAIRDAVVRAGAAGTDWRAVLAEVRPLTPSLWKGLDPRAQATFLRHAAPYWETHRHRVAPAVHDVLLGLLASGQLEVRAASLRGVDGDASSMGVHLRARGAAASERVPVSAIINCTGPDADVRHANDPLFTSLLAAGRIRPGPHNLGIDVDESGAVVGTDGVAHKTLYAIGPLRRGWLYETTAVPEIRSQIAALVKELGGFD